MIVIQFLGQTMIFSGDFVFTVEFWWCDAATVVTDAQTALDMLRERKDGNQFDLVISDVVMTKMDGFKLLELIGLEMDLPVISKALTQTHFPSFMHGILLIV